MNDIVYEHAYNLINEQLKFFKSLTSNDTYYEKQVYDYFNMLEKCSYVIDKSQKQKKEDQKILDYFGF